MSQNKHRTNTDTLIQQSVYFNEALIAGKIGLWVFDKKTNKFKWTKNFSRLNSTKNSDTSGGIKSFTKNIHPFDKERFIKKFLEYIKKDKPFHIQYRILLKNNRVKHMDLKGEVSNSLKANKIIGTITDITERKEADIRTRRTITRIEAVLKNIPEGITVEFKSGSIVYANEAALNLFEIDNSHDLNGLNIKKILKNFEITDQKNIPYIPSDFTGSRIQITLKSKRKIFLFSNKDSDIAKYLRIESSEVETDYQSPTIYIKVYQDVTKEVEEKMDTQASLGITSHELKNALTGLKGYIHLVNRRIVLNDFKAAKSYLDSLNEQSNRIIKLINDLFDVSRIRLGFLKLNKKTFDYSDLLTKTLENFKEFNQKFSVREKISKPLFVLADVDRVRQVLINLLTNSVKYSGTNKNITVRAYSENGFIITSIRDFGVGIPKGKLREIFKIYKREVVVIFVTRQTYGRF